MTEQRKELNINGRYEWADFIRGLLMILVVVYHSESYYFTGYKWSWVYEPVFLSGFFFISGFLFCRDIKQVNLKGKAKQVVRGILFPYFFFMLLMAAPKIMVGHAEAKQLMIDILMLRASWFVIAVGVMSLLYAIILRICPSVRALLVGTTIMFALGYVLVLLYRNPPIWLTDNPWLHSKELPNRLPGCINLALVQSPFYLLGILFRRNETKLRKFLGKRYLFPISSLYIIIWGIIDHRFIGSYAIVAIDSYKNIFLVFLYAVVGIWVLLCLGYMVQKWVPINFIGKHSILFYFLNGGALTITSAVLRRVPCLNPELLYSQFICVSIAIGLLFISTWIITKWFPVLTGEKSAFNRWSERLGIDVKW